ncbi:MAG: CotY/CotZ family spore coat protein, partial [Bacilli bacterium]|nr:CotY/CotZ family spore coat protein [Bacilli bacterium]
MDNNIENSNCVCDVLHKISEIQCLASFKDKNIFDCSYPRLGSECIYYNTRPIILYCADGSHLEVQIDDSSEETSYIFRVEKVKNCCAVLRILRIIADNDQNNYSLISTDQFITINTNCFCSVRCLNDTNINENILIGEYRLYKDSTLIDSGTFPFGTHFFETIDSNNEETNPSYQIQIELYNSSSSSILKLVNGISVNNPNFIIDSYTLINNNGYALLTINFTLQTVLDKNISLALLENSEEQGLFTFAIENEDGLIINFAFLMTVI